MRSQSKRGARWGRLDQGKQLDVTGVGNTEIKGGRGGLDVHYCKPSPFTGIGEDLGGGGLLWNW